MVRIIKAITSTIGYAAAYYYITLNVYILGILTRSKKHGRHDV